MDSKPCLLIVSSSSTRPTSLMKLLTNSKDISNNPDTLHRISHPWKIDTKYYTADIELVGITEEYVRTESFDDTVEALIIHMDANKASGLEDLQKWQPIWEDCDPEVKLLIANYCTDDTLITKTEATKWCLLRGFELIELYPNPAEEPEDKVGIARVIEALGTHTWSNLVMKKQTGNNSAALIEDVTDDLCDEETNDEFSELFAQLSMMKETLQTLPTNQRRLCAEHMVTAFWKTIGGDEEEIDDL